MKNVTVAAILVSVVFIIAVGLLVFKVNKNKVENGTSFTQPENSVIQNNEPTKAVTNQNNNIIPTEKTFKSAISLTVSSPVNGFISTNPTVLVKGITLPNADVAVNDSDMKADAKGTFSVSIKLDEGDNIIAIIANDDQGNVAEKELTVIYTP